MAVEMYGPAFDGSGKLVNREVPESDVKAYEAAGYVKGSLAVDIYKSADTGEFVSEDFAEANPKTTYKTKGRSKK